MAFPSRGLQRSLSRCTECGKRLLSYSNNSVRAYSPGPRLDDESTTGPSEVDTYGSHGISWFPGHMYKALNDLRERFKMVNIVLEVRDARVCVLHLCYQFSMHADRGAVSCRFPCRPSILSWRTSSTRRAKIALYCLTSAIWYSLRSCK